MTGFKSKKKAAKDKLTVDREQIEQWLEALESDYTFEWPAMQRPERAEKKRFEAITAIREALAQPEQEPDVVMHCDSHTWTINNPPLKGSGDVNLYYAPAKEKNT
jgi:hypothetical protein